MVRCIVVVNTLFAAKQQKTPSDAEGAEGSVGAGSDGGASIQGSRVQSPHRPVERQLSAVSTISAPQRRIRRIAKYQPPPLDGADVDKSPAVSRGGRPAVVVQTDGTVTPAGKSVIMAFTQRAVSPF